MAARLHDLMNDLATSATVDVEQSGTRFEDRIERIFERSGVDYERWFLVRNPFSPGKRKSVDFVSFSVRNSGDRPLPIGYEIKYQNSDGTTGEKLGTAAIRLAAMTREGYLERAFLVLGGQGWAEEHIAIAMTVPGVEFVTERELRHLSNQGLL